MNTTTTAFKGGMDHTASITNDRNTDFPHNLTGQVLVLLISHTYSLRQLNYGVQNTNGCVCPCVCVPLLGKPAMPTCLTTGYRIQPTVGWAALLPAQCHQHDSPLEGKTSRAGCHTHWYILHSSHSLIGTTTLPVGNRQTQAPYRQNEVRWSK